MSRLFLVYGEISLGFRTLSASTTLWLFRIIDSNNIVRLIPVNVVIDDTLTPFVSHTGTEAERLTLYRAVRSTEVAKRFYSLPSPGKEDVDFDLVDLERVKIGQPFSVTVNMKNKSDKPRTIQAILSAGSVYYTGVKANLVKRASGDFVLQPNASKSKS